MGLALCSWRRGKVTFHWKVCKLYPLHHQLRFCGTANENGRTYEVIFHHWHSSMGEENTGKRAFMRFYYPNAEDSFWVSLHPIHICLINSDCMRYTQISLVIEFWCASLTLCTREDVHSHVRDWQADPATPLHHESRHLSWLLSDNSTYGK